jgi:ketosteroid isomerase-like protein
MTSGPADPAARLSAESAATAANADFYEAVDAGDVERVAAAWDDADDVVCVHPGQPPIVGRGRVLRSWSLILANGPGMQVVLTDVRTSVHGDLAVVTCEENILAGLTDVAGWSQSTARFVTTNVFRRRPDGWRLWLHHASPVLGRRDREERGW